MALARGSGRPCGAAGHTALLLHRPLLRLHCGEPARAGRYVPNEAAQRLLAGPLQPTLRLVLSGHTHQYLDLEVEGVRHVWLPSTAFVLPDDMQVRIGEKLVGIGLLVLADSGARFDLWCPDGMARHDLSALDFFRAMTKHENGNEGAPAAAPHRVGGVAHLVKRAREEG